MRFHLFVRFRNDISEFAQYAVKRDRRTKEIGVEFYPRYPHEFTDRTVGAAVGALHRKFAGQIDRVEVRPVPPDDSDDSGAQGVAGYSEACGVWT